MHPHASFVHSVLYIFHCSILFPGWQLLWHDSKTRTLLSIGLIHG